SWTTVRWTFRLSGAAAGMRAWRRERSSSPIRCSTATTSSTSRPSCASISTSVGEFQKRLRRQSPTTHGAAIASYLANLSAAAHLSHGGVVADCFEDRLTALLQFLRHRRTDLFEEFADGFEFRLPLFGIYGERVSHGALGQIEAPEIEVCLIGNDSHRRLAATGASMDSIEHPFDHAQVFAVTGPDKVAGGVLAKPVDHEDARRLLDRVAQLEPVCEIIAHVVAAERQHRHRIAPQHAHRSCSRGRRF